MASDPTRTVEMTMDPASLYREEIYTDRKVGTLRVLARRWRSEDEGADSDVPYGPRGPLRLGDEGVTAPAGDKVSV